MLGRVDDRWGDRLREVVRRRHFVDREPGVLLIWLPADEPVRQELPQLARRVEARHLAARCTVLKSGAALALQVAARESDLAAIEMAYLD